MSRKKTAQQLTPAEANFASGLDIVRAHPLFAPLAHRARVQRTSGNRCPGDGWAVVSSAGVIYVHPTRLGTADEWAYVLAHCLLHLGFGHFDARTNSKEWNDACDWFLLGFLRSIQIGRAPSDMVITAEPPATSEERIYEMFRLSGFPTDWQGCGAAGLHTNDMAHEPSRRAQRSPATKIATGTASDPSWQDLFAEGLSHAVAQAVIVASGEAGAVRDGIKLTSPAERARAWFLNHYPLLGALAASFKIIEDGGVCQRESISIAAVDPETREIYFNPALDAGKRGTHYNPASRFTDEEYRFVMAHELLHVGLRHDVRRQGRDPYLWNVACFPAATWLGEGQSIEDVATMVRTYEGDLITIETQAGSISCTPEHPFFTRRRLGRTYPLRVDEPVWREARTLGIGDYLLVPKIQQTRADTVIDLREHILEGTDSLGRHTFANRAIKQIPLDEDTAWFIGLYVAEGDSSPKVRLSLSASESDIAAAAVRILHHMGYSATTRVIENTLVVSTGAQVLGRWLKKNCGGSAKTKRIPRIVLYHRDAKIRAAFLSGLVTGDGHTRKQTSSSTKYCVVGSVSERLIADVALLLAQDGIGGAHGILRRGPRRIGKQWTDKELLLHTFYWNPAGIARTERILNGQTILTHSHRWRADHHGVWYRVKAVSSAPFSGQVYNLTTPDHTYIANGFLVHNCDYVINAWLVDMKVGYMPSGALYDTQLAGDSAESIYDRIVTDLRRFRRLATMRGVGVSDILERGQPQWWERGAGVDLDAYYRGALAQGLTYHQSSGRGYLPVGLIEEIRALAQPPIPWDVELARWFDYYFPPVERVRSYARPSRRQSATPDIPRPRMVPPPDWESGRTFGIVLDTSGSMDRRLLAKGLGAVASYSMSRDVPAARVIFCDAVAYDQGYMPPETIAGEVRVRGRGGTVLQPAIDLLQHAPDFPPTGPILIITDGKCDRLVVQREHAFLMPEGSSLPFIPKGPVFRLR